MEETTQSGWDAFLDRASQDLHLFAQANPGLCIAIAAILAAAIVIAVILLLQAIIKGRIKAIGEVELADTDHRSRRAYAAKKDRLITDLPASAPRDKTRPLPLSLHRVNRNLRSKKRERIAICCSDYGCALECGRLWYHKLDEDKIGDYIGWIDYTCGCEEVLSIDLCIMREFSLHKEIQDREIRRSLQLDHLKDPRKHTILFVNIPAQQVVADTSLSRYNNLPGLSVIVIACQPIDGFTTYELPPTGGEH